jgi:hypothetical protein
MPAHHISFFYMSSPIPVSMPDELIKSVRAAAKETNLSQQDVIRQSVRLGLPRLREQFQMETAIADTWARLGPAPEIDYDKV